jgi:type II secretory pathway component PulF
LPLLLLLLVLLLLLLLLLLFTHATSKTLLQLCVELGHLNSHEQLHAVSSVCRTLNTLIKAQVSQV